MNLISEKVAERSVAAGLFVLVAATFVNQDSIARKITNSIGYLFLLFGGHSCLASKGKILQKRNIVPLVLLNTGFLLCNILTWRTPLKTCVEIVDGKPRFFPCPN